LVFLSIEREVPMAEAISFYTELICITSILLMFQEDNQLAYDYAEEAATFSG